MELQIHIDQLKKLYGHFTYAPPQTLLNKIKPFKFVSIIDGKIIYLPVKVFHISLNFRFNFTILYDIGNKTT